MKNSEYYDLVCVGTGFATTFFLKRFLEKSKENIRVLVLEKGANRAHEWYLEHHTKYRTTKKSGVYIHDSPNYNKDWQFNIGFGGGTHVWWGETPRFRENDFLLQSVYKHGLDWPIQYAELEPYYCQAESIMQIAGPSVTPFKKSKPYPQKPHIMDSFDKLIKQKYPDQYFHMPSAKPSESLPNRPQCCNSGVCSTCPIDSKFTINNSMMDVYQDKRVEIRFEKHVTSLDIQNKNAKALNYIDTDGNHKVHADLFCVGANPIFNSHILLQSDIEHPLLGKGLCDHRGLECVVDLDAYDQIAGTTNVTGVGYMLATDAMRKQYAGAIIESVTVRDQIRMEKNKYLQRAKFVFDFEDLPQMQNYVTVTDDPKVPKVVYRGHSAYTQKGIENLKNNLEKIFSDLPVERFMLGNLSSGGRHIYGGVIMGSTEENGVVDKHLRHHTIQNLVVTGSSAFPAMGLVNPALTISALSLYAADTLF